jgi:hypothetical protein
MQVEISFRRLGTGSAPIIISFFLLAGCVQSQADNLDEWVLQNTNYIASAVTCNSNLLVAVGAGIFTSTNGSDWVSANSSQYPFQGDPYTTLRGVACGNGVFVAVGSHNSGPRPDALVTSTDGSNWIQQSQVLSNGLTGIIFVNGRFVTVGAQGNVWTSSDGTNWQHGVTATTSNLNAVAYGNGLYVAVGSGPVITSTDAITWYNQTNLGPNYPDIGCIAYGNGRFVAAGFFYSYWASTDGTNWTVATFPWSDSDYSPRPISLTYAHNLFLAGGQAGDCCSDYSIIFTSTDGVNWLQRSSVGSSSWYGSVYFSLNDTFVVVGNGSIAQSEPFSGPLFPPKLLSEPKRSVFVASQNSVTFAAWGAASPPLAFQWELNGQPVTGQTNPSISLFASLTNAGDYTLVATNIMGSVTSSPATLAVAGPVVLVSPAQLPATQGSNVTLGVMVSSNTTAAYRWQTNQQDIQSATDSTLTLTNIQPSQAAPYDVIVSNSVATVTNPSLFVTVELYADHPLYNWSNATPSWLLAYRTNGFQFLGALGGIAFGDGLFVAVGDFYPIPSGLIITSPDGANWTPIYEPNALLDVIYADSTFVAVGYNGSIYSSTNGANWFLRYGGAPEYFLGRVAFTNGVFLAWGSGEPTVQSADGINWTNSLMGVPQGYSDLPLVVNGIYATVDNTNVNYDTPAIEISTNGVNWAVAATSVNQLYDLAFGNGVFVAVGQYGTILVSEPLARIAWSNSVPPQVAVRGLIGRQYGIEQRGSLMDSNGWSQPATFTLTNNPVLIPVGTLPTTPQQYFRAVLLQ